MTDMERFKAAMQNIMAVPPEKAAAIRRGEVQAPASDGAVMREKESESDRDDPPARAVRRTSGDSRKSRTPR